MNLPRLPKTAFSAEQLKVLEEWQLQIEAEFRKCRKTDADVEIAGNQRLIQTGTDDGLKYSQTIVGGSPVATLVG